MRTPIVAALAALALAAGCGQDDSTADDVFAGEVRFAWSRLEPEAERQICVALETGEDGAALRLVGDIADGPTLWGQPNTRENRVRAAGLLEELADEKC